MVGGKIYDYFIVKQGKCQAEIEFLVRDNKDDCTVNAIIPNPIIEEINFGDMIWWHGSMILLTVNEQQDVPFIKVGFSGGNMTEFYRDRVRLGVKKL